MRKSLPMKGREAFCVGNISKYGLIITVRRHIYPYLKFGGPVICGNSHGNAGIFPFIVCILKQFCLFPFFHSVCVVPLLPILGLTEHYSVRLLYFCKKDAKIFGSAGNNSYVYNTKFPADPIRLIKNPLPASCR